MGKLVKAGQIFVTSLDATPRESDVLSGLASIDAGEITADEITVSNLTITGQLLADAETVQFTGTTNVNRMTATQIGIGIASGQLLNEFQVGVDAFSINTTRENLVIVNGNMVTTNLFATKTIKTTDTTFLVDSEASNVLNITGNTYSTNVMVGRQLLVGTEAPEGSNVAIFENGNVVIRNGILQIFGDVDISGNLAITEIPSYTSVNNLVVSNAVIQMGTGNNGSYDTAILMVDEPGASNIFLGYTQNDDTFKLTRTFGGPENQTFTLDTSNTTNLHIFGELYTQNNVGIANTAPTYSLSIGSNLYVNDTAGESNVLYANGYGFFEGLRVGERGLTVGNLITMDADAAIPVIVNSQIKSHGIRTTGDLTSGIANTAPQHTLSIGNKIFFDAVGANAVTVLGNTVTSRLITESIRVQDFIEVEGDSGITSVANVLIHGDTGGPDTTSNAVTIRAGPLLANTSRIDVFGASLSPSHQLIQFVTKNTERMRISSTGNVGISNTSPTDKLTVGGTVRVIGSNAFTMGTDTIYMKTFSDVTGNQTKIESRVGTGKGVNFYASTTGTMGPAKMTILESSNVGIGTTTPQGRLHTSGGTAFINTSISDGVNHLLTPLVVTNTEGITSVTDDKPVLELSRTATGSKGVRVAFKLGKYQFSGATSRSKLDIYLADDTYASETDVMTLQADGRVGIGSTQPEAFLEVVSSGIGNARVNSLMIHNHGESGAGDAIMAAQTDTLNGNAFISFIQTDGDDDPRGWSAGITGTTADFRITSNVDAVSNVASTALYIHGLTRDVGIGTDTPRAKLEVSGNVIIGNQLTFGGVDTDQTNNTFMLERLYNNDGKSELLIFKGNEGQLAEVSGPDRIRSIAPVHIFQTYDSTGLDESEIDTLIQNEPGAGALLTVNKDRVLIGTSTDPGGNSRLYINGGFSFAEGSKISTGVMDIFSTAASGGIGVIDNVDSSLAFRQSGSEYARFTKNGLFGIGTTTPTANIHVYSSVTTDVDMLKLQSPGTNTKTGIILNTNDTYGGYVRGYSQSGTIHGITLGGMNNATEADGLHVIHTSNVGVGTSAPATKFHVYNGVSRVESSTTSNAIIEIKTTGGTSNILCDVSGNVYINPVSYEMIINSNLEVIGDLSIEGKIDLGNQVAVDLGGETANTSLQVGGGFISGSNQVACKKYSRTIIRGDGASKDIQLRFGNGSFYAKIVSILRVLDGQTEPGGLVTYRDMSTLILEVQGGTHNESTSAQDEVITVGTKNLFGGNNQSPWDTNVIVGTKGIILKPDNPSADRQYSYDIHVELISSRNGKLIGIYTNNPSPNNPDNFGGTALVSNFGY